MSNQYQFDSTITTPEALHAHFLAILPRIETHAKIHFRYLHAPARRKTPSPR